MRLTKLSLKGLKARDREIDLGPVVILAGSNGSGKSAVLSAIHLLVTGKAPGVPDTSAGAMRLARGDAMAVRGTWDDGTTVERVWKRAKDGAVKETLKTSLGDGRLSQTEAKGLVRGTLGGLTEAWSPGELFDLSAAKLRSRLLQLLPASEFSIAALAPKDCPAWATPKILGEEEPEAWISRAIARGAELVREAQADVRKSDATAEEFGEAWAGPVDPAPVAADLKSYRDKLLVLHSQAMLAERIKSEEAELARRRAKLVAPAAAEPGMSPEDLDTLESTIRLAAVGVSSIEQQIEAAEATLERVSSKQEIEQCPNCGHSLTEAAAEMAAVMDSSLKALAPQLKAARAEKAKLEQKYTAAKAASKAAREERSRYESAKRAIGELEVQLEILRAEYAEMVTPSESADLLEQKIAAAQKKLSEIGAANERAAQWERAKADAAMLAARIDTLKGEHARLVAIEGRMLAHSKVWLEERLSSASGQAVTVELDGKGCRVLVGGVDVSVRSGGEHLTDMAALVTVIAGASQAWWKPMILDGLEAVSMDRRHWFVSSMAESVKAGTIDQVIAAGCADTMLTDDATVVDFDSEEEERGAA